MKATTYAQLNHPLAQLEAAEEFCLQIEAHSDEWYDHLQEKYGDAPNTEEIHSVNVLDVIACMGLRFELGGALEEDEDVGDGYFRFKFRGRPIDHVLHSDALRVAKGLRELLQRVGVKTAVTLAWYLVTSALGQEDLIFVADPDGVAGAAYQLALRSKFDLSKVGGDEDR